MVAKKNGNFVALWLVVAMVSITPASIKANDTGKNCALTLRKLVPRFGFRTMFIGSTAVAVVLGITVPRWREYERRVATEALGRLYSQGGPKPTTATIHDLLNRGGKIELASFNPLIGAAEHGDIEAVKLLLDRGGDIHAGRDAALRFAAWKGHLAVVELLVERGANLHEEGDEALIMSAQNGYTEVVKFLVSNGAQVNAQSNRALAVATLGGHLEIVEYLLKNGADIDAVE